MMQSTMDIIEYLNGRDVNTSNFNSIPVVQRANALRTLYDREMLNNLLQSNPQEATRILEIIHQALSEHAYRHQIDIVSIRAFHEWVFGERDDHPDLTPPMKKFILGFHCSTNNQDHKYYRARYDAAATIQNAHDMGGETPHSQDEWYELRLRDEYGVIIFNPR